MARSEDAFVGRATFAEGLAKTRVDNCGPATLRVYRADEDGGRVETVEASTFRLLGAGMDEAVLFTCVDPFAPEGRPLFACGEVSFGSIFPATPRCETAVQAGEEAVKFVLRIPEEDRAAAWERMKAYGAQWRARR